MQTDQLGRLRLRLLAESPTVPRHLIDEAIAGGWEHTAADRIGTYRLLFVARYARAYLDCRRLAGAAAPVTREPVAP